MSAELDLAVSHRQGASSAEEYNEKQWGFLVVAELKTDYLIVGSGLVGMAFADTLLTETDANLIIVDRYAKPGGHTGIWLILS